MIGDLPTWQLDDLVQDYKEAIEILSRAKDSCKTILEDFHRIVSPPINPEQIHNLLIKIENTLKDIAKGNSYIYLKYAENTNNKEAYRYLTLTTTITGEIDGCWSQLESLFINLGEETLISLMEHPSLKNYKHFFEKLIRKLPHKLSPESEKIIAIKNATTKGGIIRLYDNLSGLMIAKREEKTLTFAEIRSLRMSSKKDERIWAWNTMLSLLKSNLNTLGGIFTIISIDWDQEAKIRNYPSPVSMRNIENDIADDIVDIMSSITWSNTYIPQKYWNWKKEALKTGEKLPIYDLFAPLNNNQKIEWNEAKELILESLESFDRELFNIAKQFFEKRRIDAPPRLGKMGGAFCMYQAPAIPIYILVNFTGTLRDVSTLAHEIGHGIHGVLSGKQTPLNFDPPLALAEVASTFNELLLHDYIRNQGINTTTEIAAKIEDIIGTIFRQNTLFVFEKQAHNMITSQGAGLEEISDLYLSTYKHLFGNIVEYPEDYKYEWLGIPHFIHTPFYVYAYTLAELISLLIFKRYKEGYSNFKEQYKNLLSAGGSENPKDLLLKYMNIDIQDPKTWEEALKFIESYFLSYLSSYYYHNVDGAESSP